MPANYSFSASEVATILHGLRLIQETANGPDDCVFGACEHFEDSPALNDKQIDALCERINPLDADAKPTDREAAFINAAREMINGGCHFSADEIEIDDGPDCNGNYPKTSIADESGGAWVAAWVWVENADAGFCRECGEPGADNGEGWDGLCGNCADKEEASN